MGEVLRVLRILRQQPGPVRRRARERPSVLEEPLHRDRDPAPADDRTEELVCLQLLIRRPGVVNRRHFRRVLRRVVKERGGAVSEYDEFLEALQRHADDTSLRLVLADWLDERGEHEEADRQRQWPAAKEWFVRLCHEHNPPPESDPELDRISPEQL